MDFHIKDKNIIFVNKEGFKYSIETMNNSIVKHVSCCDSEEEARQILDKILEEQQVSSFVKITNETNVVGFEYINKSRITTRNIDPNYIIFRDGQILAVSSKAIEELGG